jgi:hypothetical protein
MINIDTASLTATSDYVFRFMPPGTTYNSSISAVHQIYSGEFSILPAAVSSSSASASSASTSSTSAPSAVTSTPASPTGSTADTASKATSSGLSTGAKAGIGVGCGVVAIAACALAFAFGRSRRRLPTDAQNAGYPHDLQQPKPASPTELHSQMTWRAAELPSAQQSTYYTELPGK